MSVNDKKAKPKKTKLPKKKYILKVDLPTEGKLYKKGDSIMLTEKGRRNFKRLNRI